LQSRNSNETVRPSVVNRCFVKLFPQNRRVISASRVRPAEDSRCRLPRHVNPDEAVPKRRGGDCRDFAFDVFGFRQNVVNRFNDLLKSQRSVNFRAAVIGRRQRRSFFTKVAGRTLPAKS
jgi:hypothetical protein